MEEFIANGKDCGYEGDELTNFSEEQMTRNGRKLSRDCVTKKKRKANKKKRVEFDWMLSMLSSHEGRADNL